MELFEDIVWERSYPIALDNWLETSLILLIS